MTSITMTSRQTMGERRVAQLLNQLSSNYFAVSEPMIGTRAGSKHPDFVLVARYLGVAVMEVKDWKEIQKASQKEFTVRKTDGTIQVFENPYRTAREYAQDVARKFQEIESLLGSHLGRTALAFPWQEVTILSNISQALIAEMEEKGILPSGVVLGKEKLESVDVFEDAITNLPWRFRLKTPLGQYVLDGIRSVIDPEIIIQSPQGEFLGVETLHQEKLIREQPEPVDITRTLADDGSDSPEVSALITDLNVRLVRGVAGSGKTLVLIRRVEFLKKHFPQYRVLVMTFNTDLTADLQRRIGHEDEGIEVTNFHKLCAKVMGQQWQSPSQPLRWLRRESKFIADNGLSLDFVVDEIKWRKDIALFDNEAYLTAARSGRGSGLVRAKREVINQIFDRYRQAQANSAWDWEDVPHRAYEVLEAGGSTLSNAYDVILLDEAQDFAPSWMQVVKALLKPGGSLMVCDDPTQSMFRYFSWKEKGLNVVGKTAVLRIPFRSTRLIAEAAFSLVENDPILSAADELTKPRLNIGELRVGDKPRLLHAASAEVEAAAIDKAIAELIAQNVPAEQIAVLCHNKQDTERYAALAKRGVYVASYDKMKGLEFWAVFLPHLNTAFDTTDHAADEIFVSQRRRRLYVGMTRARNGLMLSYHGQLPEPLRAILPHVEYSTAKS